MKRIPLQMSVTSIQKAFYFYENTCYEMVVPNCYAKDTTTEMDLFCLRPSGYSDEIEIKRSVSDFKADFKKTVHIPHTGYMNKHEALQKGLLLCNRFAFLVTSDIADKIVVPDYCGLHIVRFLKNGGITVDKKRVGQFLHKNKITEEQKYYIARKMVYRYWQNN